MSTKPLLKRIDIDATSRCTLKCPACMRQNYYGVRNKPVPGKDISVKDFQKIVDHFDDICLIGNLSDPTTHPKLYTLLKMCIEKNRSVILSVASSHRSVGWFKRHFLLTRNKNILWEFAIDGLPEDSHKYRINQDGKKLFDIMKIGHQLGCKVVWKYIIFKYNENDMDKAKDLASKSGIRLNFIKSVRWDGEMSKYRPTDKNNYFTREFTSDYGGSPY